jgi:hypothetical protein
MGTERELAVMTIEIPLTRGYVTRIDDADLAFTDGHSWCAITPSRGCVYAARTGIDRKTVYMHKLLCPEWDLVDHADGDGLNNCRSNLRDGSGFRNHANKGMLRNNTSGYKGVAWHAHGGKWIARIYVSRKQICLGYFGSPEAAAFAYDQAAVRLFGEYAQTNAMLGLL